MNTRATLTAAQIAAIESGVPLAEVAAIPGSEVTDPKEVQAAAEALAAEQGEGSGASKPEVAAGAGGSGDPKPEAQAPGDIVAFLQGQVAERDKNLLDTNVELRAAQARITAMEASHTALLDIARGAVGKMQIALGGSAADLTSLDATAVLAQHAAISETFKKKFPSGGVAVPTKDDDEASRASATVTNIDVARRNAVQFGRGK